MAYRSYGCRCPQAREAERIYRKRHRENRAPVRLVPCLGTTRRLRALAVAGYSLNMLADELGISRDRVYQLRSGRVPTIGASQARFIAERFDRLPDLGDNAPDFRTREKALAAGWAPPMAWDNVDDASELPKHQLPDANGEAELELLMAGLLPPEKSDHRSQLNDEAVRILDEKGVTAPQMAALLKISVRSVVRVRARIGISHVAPPTQAELNPGIARANRRNTNQAEAPHSTAHERHHEAA